MRMFPVLMIELAGFAIVAIAIWLDELFNLPHRLFGAPMSNFNLYEAAFESFAVLMLGFLVVFITDRLLKRIMQLESFLPICMFCKCIRKQGGDFADQESWVQIEQYINKKTGSTFSHGLCPECAKKHYGVIVNKQS